MRRIATMTGAGAEPVEPAPPPDANYLAGTEATP